MHISVFNIYARETKKHTIPPNISTVAPPDQVEIEAEEKEYIQI